MKCGISLFCFASTLSQMKTNPLSLCGGSKRGLSHGWCFDPNKPGPVAAAWAKAPQPYGLEQPLDFVILTPSHPLVSLQNKNMPDHKPQHWDARDETACCPHGVGRAMGRERGQAQGLSAWEESHQRAAHCAPPTWSRWDSKNPCLKQDLCVLLFSYSAFLAGRCGKGLSTSAVVQCFRRRACSSDVSCNTRIGL